MTGMLTESEVAELLRCSPSKIKRLRLAGKLAYLPGRPVLIREEDITAYLDAAIRPAAPRPKQEADERNMEEAIRAEAQKRASQRARAVWLQRRTKSITR